ncbi:MAG: AAA family ATPase [Actinomycetota bacterium]|nr:AAA family ATPase [Actinomycetota bacterium]
MLDELSVSNLGLIPSARLEPGPGLVVITGETGTGKTLLLGALRLLRGEQARKDQIGPNGDETTVEARFIEGDEESILGRRVDRRRSRASIDGAMATAGNLAEALSGVLDVVGQHDRTLLSEPKAVRHLLDGAMAVEGQEALGRYRGAWETLVDTERQAAALGGDHRALERELDMVRFQRDEIAAAGFVRGEDEEIAERASRLRNSEELRERLAAVESAAGESGASVALESADRELRAASRTAPSLSPLADLSGQLNELLSEFNAEIARVRADLDHDPADLERVEQRLALLGDLKRKYGDDLDAVLLFESRATERAEELETLLDRSGKIAGVLAVSRADVTDAARALSRQRRETGDRISANAVEHLQDLGFSNPFVAFRLIDQEPGPQGADRVVLEFASDTGLVPGPVAKIASGGELSRLILALRLASGTSDAPIIAFDEIDTGTGGATALAMGKKLKDLAAERQVFCVTHLPQVAAFAETHFVVRREGNTATVTKLQGDERLEELSRMLAGLPDSERGREHAAELLAIAGGETP